MRVTLLVHVAYAAPETCKLFKKQTFQDQGFCIHRLPVMMAVQIVSGQQDAAARSLRCMHASQCCPACSRCSGAVHAGLESMA